MDLTQYVDALRAQVALAAEAGGGEFAATAERLMPSLEAATRLMLLEALSAAASEITSELAPGSVDVRLRGRNPEFVVVAPAAEPGFLAMRDITPEGAPPPNAAERSESEEGGTSRTTLRVPEQLKTRIEQAAAQEGLSVNAWLIRAISAALEARERGSAPPHSSNEGERYVGWVR